MAHGALARRGLVVVAVVAMLPGCSSAPSAAPPTVPIVSAPTASLAATPSPTPGATLPNGLAARPRLQPLVDGEVAACVPRCTKLSSKAGLLSAGERYQTKLFFGGYMTITPRRAWFGDEDSTGELSLFLPGQSEYRVHFWLDPYPAKDGARVPGVPFTSAALIGWLQGEENFVVSQPTDARVGALPATVIDVHLSSRAPQQYDDCASPCVDMLGFEQFDDPFGGIRGDDVDRIYFADVQYSGTTHVLVVTVEGRDRADLDSVMPAVDELLETLTVPARPAVAVNVSS